MVDPSLTNAASPTSAEEAGPSSPEKLEWIRAIRMEQVDTACSHLLYREFLEFAQQHETDPHYLRNCQTIATFLNSSSALDDRAATVLECGGLSLIGQFLRAKGFSLAHTTSDLRYEIDATDRSVDVVLSLEVIEHIKDQRETQFSDIVLFNGTGVRCYCAELARVSKPGATLLITTPNPCSLRALQNLMIGEPPMIYRPHEREYTRAELVELMQGFSLDTYFTHYSFFNLGSGGPRDAGRLFGALGVSAEDRGDDHFLLFRRTG